MAGKITELAALATPADDDLVEVVDISDTSMAASGTNKKVALSDLGVGGGGGGAASVWAVAPMSTTPRLWNPNIGYAVSGLPGRHIRKDIVDANKKTTYEGWRFLCPFYVSEPSISVKYYTLGVETAGAAGSKIDLGIYSVPDWQNARTASLIAGTKFTVDSTTTGTKICSFGPVILATGYYWLGFVAYGGATTPSLSYMLEAGDFMAADVALSGGAGNVAVYNDSRTPASGLPVGNFTVGNDGYLMQSIWVTLVLTPGT